MHGVLWSVQCIDTQNPSPISDTIVMHVTIMPCKAGYARDEKHNYM